jgi:Flp pilus assembly pilin Flp
MRSRLAGLGLLARSDDGQAATEYAVLVALIAIGVLVTMSSFGDSINGIYLAIANAVSGIS